MVCSLIGNSSTNLIEQLQAVGIGSNVQPLLTCSQNTQYRLPRVRSSTASDKHCEREIVIFFFVSNSRGILACLQTTVAFAYIPKFSLGS